MAVSTAHTASQLNALGYDYPMIPGSPSGGSINSTYGIGYYPTTIIIAPNRAIVNQDIWPISNTILRNAITTAGGVPTTCPSTSVEEAEVTGISIFPNPVADVFEISNITSKTQIEIFNMNGKLVDSFVSSENIIYNATSLESGLYFIRTLDESSNLASFKIIKL